MSFYCQKTIQKGRKVKECDCCDKTINMTLHYVVPDEYMECSFVICPECMEKAEKMYAGKEWDGIRTFLSKMGASE